MRRQKALTLSAEIFCDIIRSTTELGSELPEDIRLQGARFHAFTNLVEFLFDSTEFPELPPGAEPEQIL